MKASLCLCMCLILAGCVTVPIKRSFPEAPPSLLTPCSELLTVPTGTTLLSQTISVITENYAKYHECQLKTDLWIEWYATQKEIFNSVK